MRSIFKLSAIIVLVAVIGFVITACDNGNDDDGGKVTVIASVEETSGRLTITGLDDYEGKYVVAKGANLTYSPDKQLFAASGVSGSNVTGSKIVNGAVELKIWEFVENDNALNNFSSVETLTFLVYAFGKATVTFNEGNFQHEDISIAATLYYGVGAQLFFKVEPTSGSLTINGLDTYNGSYLVAFAKDSTDTSAEYLYAAANISDRSTGANTVTSGQISSGSVELKVWKTTTIGQGYKLGNFNGTGEISSFRVFIIYPSSFIAEYHKDGDDGHEHGYGTSIKRGRVNNVTVSNGSGTGAITLDP